MPGSAVNPTLDIIDTILSDPSFKMLLSALQSADMIDRLKSPGPFTLFAPTDEAFARLEPGEARQLQKPENSAKLMRLLEGLLVEGRHDLTDLTQRGSIETVGGKRYAVVSNAAGVTVASVHLAGHEIRCTNGMIHAIDTVFQQV